MIYYVYSLPPCDDWDGFVSVKDYLATGGKRKWVNKMREIAAEATFWEGNPHTEMVSAIPDVDNWPLLIYCAKQSNNGTTFVVSPTPLWHLHKNDEYHVVEFKLVEYVEKIGKM